MAEHITCVCGYRGPGVAEGDQTVCPICRTPAGRTAAGRPVARPAVPPAPVPKVDDWMPEEAGLPPAPAKSVRYRIPCPRGHVLKAPESMLDQQAVCPQCNEVFVLRITDSLEYKKEQEKIDRQREEEMARKWLRRAVWAAVFIVASLAGMIAVNFYFR
jgi:hypothetical protein